MADPHDTAETCPNPYCKGGWIERSDNESCAAPAFPCRAEGCPHDMGAGRT